ncbi:peptidylprolyl isomerase [Pseudoalteromonas xiamenensis]|nr:peptidylprolyl isomerase [Pseudoalteromonas xiamenensis]
MNGLKSIVAAAMLVCSQQGYCNLSPHEIIQKAPPSAWRTVANENVLRITLPTGHVYVELNPELAPGHVDNIKALAREGFYKGLSVYRFVEGFVAQGGDALETKTPKLGKKAIPAEFALSTKQPLLINKLGYQDGYAASTGFYHGFAVAQNAQGTKTWQTHCTGAFAMARGDGPDTGGTEFYITLAPQRYLDLNITVFGRVLAGMEHVQKLDREAAEGKVFNLITDVVVLNDVVASEQTKFQVMNTESDEFSALIKARAHRPEAWFLARPDFTDVCSVAIPTKRLEKE